ncbi:DUF305 domain-containing protein [Thalassiella azotivora]
MPRTPTSPPARVPAPSAGRTLTAVAALAAVLAVGGCSGGDPDGQGSPDAAATAEGDRRVIVPGRPGEPAVTLTDPPAARVEHDVDPDDVRFLQDMAVHHSQALTMAAMAPERAGSDRLRSFAERIAVAQEPEIQVMTAQLEAWGEEPPRLVGDDHADHSDHSGMPGMASPADLDRLEAARGGDFDRLFIDLMTAHHQGALVMVEEVLREGTDEVVAELATGIGVTQTKEIQQLADLRAAL